jgi:hypothetical protein
MAHYGYHNPSITSPFRGKVIVQAIEDHIEHKEHVLQLLKDNVAIAQNRDKQHTNQHHNKMDYKVGDGVFFRLQP